MHDAIALYYVAASMQTNLTPLCAPCPLATVHPVHAFFGVETSFVFQVHPCGLRGAAHDLRYRYRRRLRVRV